MRITKGKNAQATLTKRQAEREASAKRLAFAAILALLVFLVLLMVESSVISDETYVYVLAARTEIPSGTYISKDNYGNYIEPVGISSRSKEEYNHITLDGTIQHYWSVQEAESALLKRVEAVSYLSNTMNKMDYLNLDTDLTSTAQYLDVDTTKGFYATDKVNKNNFTKIEVVDPMEIAFNGGSTTESVLGEIRAGDIVEIGYRINSSVENNNRSYFNGWDKINDVPVLVTHKMVTDFDKLEGYYTVYSYGVDKIPGGNVVGSQGEILKTVPDINYIRSSIYVSDAETGKVLMVVEPPVRDTAGNDRIKNYETYKYGLAPGQYILMNDGQWVHYNSGYDYSNSATPEQFNAASHFMDMSAVYVTAAMQSAGTQINVGANEDGSTTGEIASAYKLIISKNDIEYFYKFLDKGAITMTKVLDANTDPRLVMPNRQTIAKVQSRYVEVLSVNILDNGNVLGIEEYKPSVDSEYVEQSEADKAVAEAEAAKGAEGSIGVETAETEDTTEQQG